MRLLATLLVTGLMTMSAQAAETPYQVEWVYHIQSGHEGDWWKMSQKYQIPILDREKQLGFVTNYIVEKPGLHTSEDARWNYRVLINFPITKPRATAARLSARCSRTAPPCTGTKTGAGN